MIAESRPDEVQTVDLDYPADAEVKIGATRGARILIDTLNVQADACPEQRFILLGYSQGALIVGDAIASPEVRLIGASVGELAPDAAERVLAVVLYGDPRFRGAESYDVGDFDPSVNGVLPRPAGSLDAFADRLRDYCVSGDIVCQSGFDLDESGHVAYYSNGMQQDGAAFVITRLGPPESAEDDAAPSKGRTPVGGAEPDESD
ncbi:cutinase family protein [Leucobacter soli]